MEFERNALYIIAVLPRAKDQYKVEFTTWSIVHCTAEGTLNRFCLESIKGRLVSQQNLNFAYTEEFRDQLCLIYCLALPGDRVDVGLLNSLCAVLTPPDIVPKEWVSKRWLLKVILAVKQRNISLVIDDMEVWFQKLIQQVQAGMDSRRLGVQWPRYMIHPI